MVLKQSWAQGCLFATVCMNEAVVLNSVLSARLSTIPVCDGIYDSDSLERERLTRHHRDMRACCKDTISCQE